MILSRLALLPLALVLGALLMQSPSRADGPAAGAPKPPEAKRAPVSTTLHGKERTDEYGWLREKDAPAVKAHLEAENAYARAVMAPSDALQAKLAAEILAVPAAAKGKVQTTRLTAKARDGTEIPVTLLSKAGVKADGKAPLVLYGFGAYGTALPSDFAPAYAPERVPLLERGVVFAFAHVRGGGEKGDAWHEGGRVATKMNSVTDFIDVADHLVASRWAAKGRVAAMGESAGGIVVGAALNQRPELFKAALLLYPFVDCVSTMLDPSLPDTVDEYEEWGDPRKPDECAAMLAWSPYDNLAPRAYPAVLARTAMDDDEVMYWEPAKYVARLRAVTTGGRPALLRTTFTPAGHLGSDDPGEHAKDRALDWAFVLRELGVEK